MGDGPRGWTSTRASVTRKRDPPEALPDSTSAGFTVRPPRGFASVPPRNRKGLYLSVVGIREMHGTTTGKAALVVLIPFAVVLVVALVVLAWVGLTVFNQA